MARSSTGIRSEAGRGVGPARRALAALALLLLGLAPVRLASADATDDRVAAARKALLGRLEGVASWCDGQRVFGVRDEVFRRILTLAPDHARARAALKFKRENSKGDWVQSPEYRAPTDWNKGLVPEGRQRLAEALTGYRRDVMAALDAAVDLAPGRREEVVERLIDVVPDDADLRRSRGDVERDGHWVLPETVDATKRRREIAEAVERARGEFRDERDAAALAAGWKAAWRIGARAVVGTVKARDALPVASAIFTTEGFCGDLLALEERPLAPPTVYVLPDRDQAKDLLRRRDASPALLQLADEVVSAWTPAHELLVYAADAERRRRVAVMQMVDTYLAARTRGNPPWVSVGVAQRLTWHVIDSHGPGFGRWEGTDRPVDDPDDAPLPAPEAPWLPYAASAVDRGGTTGFRTLFTRKLNGFRSADVLTAYGLAAYLIEGRPEAFLPFLDAATASADPDAICRSVFSVDADVFYWRLRRWLLEQ